MNNIAVLSLPIVASCEDLSGARLCAKHQSQHSAILIRCGGVFDHRRGPFWWKLNRAMRGVLLMVTLALLPSICRAQDDRPLVHEGIVNGPLDQVWAAYTTKAGLESWMVAHAEIELKVGGTMKTQYNPKGTVDDATAIVNTILSYEPMRMVSIKVLKAPQGFPFPNAIKNMWTVLYFDAHGEKATRVRCVSMGFGDDDESRKMREFFNRGNAITLERFQKRFAAKADAHGQDKESGKPNAESKI